MDHWTNTVLISALTAGLVALGIEWLAKPRLEARKERLLELHRARRTFEANILRVLADSVRVRTAAGLPGLRDLKPEVRQAVRAEVARAVQRIDDTTREMADSLEDYGLSYPFTRVQSLIVGYVAAARGIQLSDRTQVEKAEILQEITAPVHTVLCTRWWHFKSRVGALMELPSVLAKYNPEVEPVAKPAKADEIPAAAGSPAQSGS